MTLFWHPTGPFLRYSLGYLHIEDLNPEIWIKWSMSRLELFRVGLRFIIASIRVHK